MAKRKRKTRQPPRESSEAQAERYGSFLKAQDADDAVDVEDLRGNWLFSFRGSSRLQEEKRNLVRQGEIE